MASSSSSSSKSGGVFEQQESDMGELRPHFSVVFLGAQEHGKSTLIARLMALVSVESSNRDEEEEKERKRKGKKEEQKQQQQQQEEDVIGWPVESIHHRHVPPGVNARVTRHWSSSVFLETPYMTCTVINCPGNTSFLSNIVTAISMANAAVVVLSAVRPELEGARASSGALMQGLVAARTQGIRRLVVCVNKMDDPEVEYSQECFEMACEMVSERVRRVSFGVECSAFVPVSARHGHNVVARDRRLMPWYRGPSLLEALEGMAPPRLSLSEAPLRVNVTQVHRIAGVGTVAVGAVVQGVVRPGTVCRVSPTRNRFRQGALQFQVRSVEQHHRHMREGRPGMLVGLALRHAAAFQLRRGMVLSNASDRPLPAGGVRSFAAYVISLAARRRRRVGYSPVVHCGSAHATCRLEKVLREVDMVTKEPISRSEGQEEEQEEEEDEPLAEMRPGATYLVRMVPITPLCVETPQRCWSLSRLTMRDGNRVVMVGVVHEVEHDWAEGCRAVPNDPP